MGPLWLAFAFLPAADAGGGNNPLWPMNHIDFHCSNEDANFAAELEFAVVAVAVANQIHLFAIVYRWSSLHWERRVWLRWLLIIVQREGVVLLEVGKTRVTIDRVFPIEQEQFSIFFRGNQTTNKQKWITPGDTGRRQGWTSNPVSVLRVRTLGKML